jgi:quercetin dioxygenase-like cupin family protein
MNSQITTLNPVSSSFNLRTLLAKEGFTCSLIMLEPGDEAPRRDPEPVEEHILYVVEGEVTVHFDRLNTILTKDEALLIPRDKEHVITANSGGLTKLLRVDVPPRQVVVPQIISVER